MLNFTDLTLRRGVRELLQDVSLTIHAKQRVGVTGANGTGKSSLFALIRGELQPDKGDFSMPPNLVIAHVAQETPAMECSAIDYVMDGDVELRRVEAAIAGAEKSGNGAEMAKHFAHMEAIDGYRARSRASKLMHGLGFSREEEDKPVTAFSGGWRMRLNLAQALMCRSDLLLLDEPTNHLDLDAVLWLEEWLLAYAGTLLLISHDRDFLDRITTHIVHLEQQQLTSYTGNYSAFEVRRAEQLALQQSAYEKQQREIARMQKFVDRFKAKATKAKQAQSRVKALERMEVISQAHVDSPFSFSFFAPQSCQNPLLKLSDAAAGYEGSPIVANIKWVIGSGDRIGLLGHNGAGKSTLIKMLAGTLPNLSGERLEAKDLKIGYFAQHQLEQLDDDADPITHLQRIDVKATEQSLRNYLGGFGFHGDMATAKIAPMSGGEKARLSLALIVYQKPNLLLLDEPTNHLDLDMRLALSTALQDYEGAMIIVSHDRHLLRTVTDTFLLVDSGKLTEFAGDLDDYRQWVRDEAKQSDANEEAAPVGATVSRKQQRQSAAERRNLLKPLTNKVKKWETEVERLTAKHEAVQAKLSDSSLYEDENKADLTRLISEQTELANALEQAESEWMTALEALEKLESDLG